MTWTEVGTLPSGGPGGGASTLNDLTDVDTAGAVAGEVLGYDGTGWVAGGATHNIRHATEGGYDYTGTAATDTAEGSVGWAITRINLGTSPIAIATSTGAWTNRAALTYA